MAFPIPLFFFPLCDLEASEVVSVEVKTQLNVKVGSALSAAGGRGDLTPETVGIRS